MAFLDYRDWGPRAIPNDALEAELREAGLDVDRVSTRVGETARLWRGRETGDWLRRGRSAQAAFERTVREKTAWVSGRFATAAELWAAISSGELGAGVRGHATVFFRNREESRLRESDLRSFLDDCELLGLLEENGG